MVISLESEAVCVEDSEQQLRNVLAVAEVDRLTIGDDHVSGESVDRHD
jgi:hypothetical protein